MSLRAIRAYSTQSAPLGVQLRGQVLSVLAPRAPDSIDLFTAQKQGDREATLQKLESALLRAQLNRHNRKLVFSQRTVSKWVQEEAPVFKMAVGNTSKEIRLVPRKPVETLSQRDLRTVSFTGQTADEVRESANLLIQFVRTHDRIPATDALFENARLADHQLFTGLLRRAAGVGIFEEIYQKLVVALEAQLSPKFFLEALRIYALRVPYLSSRSKAVLEKMHRKADKSSGAQDFLYAYGLAQFGAKFGADKVGTRLTEVLKRIETDIVPQILPSPRRSLKSLTVSDLVLGHEAVKLANLPEFEGLQQKMTEILQRVQGEKPIETAYTVDISDRVDEDAEASAQPEEGSE